MWTRKELKARGKAAFQANYWRSVLVALLIVFVIGSGASTVKNSYDNGKEQIPSETTVDVTIDGRHYTNITDALNALPKEVVAATAAAVLGAIGLSAVAGILIDILLINPLEVGCRRFFFVNSSEPGDLKELTYGFQHHYGNVVETTLLRDVYHILWTLLFIVPGIVKAFSYSMVPYILAENPEMKPKEAITLSRQIMNGNKWKLFVLDLSFIGWDILSVITLGIVGVFYASPYQCATHAEFYKAIRQAD